MMKRFQPLLIALLVCLAFACPAQQNKANKELSRLPPPVRKTIRDQMGHGKLNNVQKDTENGDVSYEVQITRDGKQRGFTVNEAGELLDEEVFLSELPAPVQQAIQRFTAKQTLGEIDKSVADGETSYDIEVIRDGKTRGLTINADGKLLSEEILITDLSLAFQQIIQKQAGTGTVASIEKSLEDADGSYSVEITRDGKNRTLTFGPHGELLDEEVLLGDLSPAAQQAVQKQIGSGTLSAISKSSDDGQLTYDVEFTQSGKTNNFTISATGQLLSADVLLSDLPAPLQAAIQKAAGDSKIGEIEKNIDDGEISYDVNITGHGPDRTLSFDPDGTLFSTDEDVNLSDAPEAVKKQVATLTGTGKLLGLSKITEDGKISYDIGIKNGPDEKTISLDADGKVIAEAGK